MGAEGTIGQGAAVTESKIFAIGLSRSGTTSLHVAFQMLGIDSAPTSVGLMPLLDDPAADTSVLSTARAFTDNPIPFLYPTLDEICPRSQFVLTTRPVEDWLRSMEWLFGPGLARLDPVTRRLGHEVHERLYGITRFDEQVLGEIHTSHHRGVDAFFDRREGDLLRIDLARFGWTDLCRFLAAEEPAEDFPHLNGRQNERKLRRVLRRFGGATAGAARHES